MSQNWIALVGVVAGIIGGGVIISPLRTWLSRTLANRRYQARLQSLEVAADQRANSGGARLESARDLAEDIRPIIPSHFPYFFIRQLHVNNLRCFLNEDLELRFPGERSDLLFPNVNLLLGDNGTGKSTILRAIAMAALGPVLQSSGFVPFKLITEGAKRADVAGTFIFGGVKGPTLLPSEISVIKRGDFEQIEPRTEGSYWSDLFDESSPSFFIVGYGTNRRVADEPRSDPSLERGRRRRRYQRVASLFDESASLVPIGSWLPQANDDRKADVKSLMRRLLPAGSDFTGRFEGGEPIFERHGFDIPLRALSDGFRSYIGWLSDLLFQMSAVAPAGIRLKEIGGIVLVDEVDLLLHPSWQRVVVPTISRLLPNVQFIFTTHSPIVTGTLQAGNVIVTREREISGISALEHIDAEIHGLNAEQVLLSSYFELETTRAPDAVPALEDLARRAVQGDEEATRDYLRALASDPRSAGESGR